VNSKRCAESENYTIYTKWCGHHIRSLPLFVELSNTLRYIRGLTPADVTNAVEALKALHPKVVSDLEIPI